MYSTCRQSAKKQSSEAIKKLQDARIKESEKTSEETTE
jgi:hypothetical protein